MELRWLPMLFALACAFGFFTMVMVGKLRLLMVQEHRPDLFRELPRRFSNVIYYAFAQKKMFKEPVPGLMHAFIFWGFLVLQIRTLYLIILAFDPTFHLPWIHYEYLFAKDITELIVLIMCVYAAYRRVVVKPKRLSHSVEALVVLAFIGGLMVSDFLYDGFYFARMGQDASLTSAQADILAKEMAYSPVGATLAGWFESWSTNSVVAFEEMFYWSHIFIVLVFLNLLPGSKHFHVITAIPNVFFGETKEKGALLPIKDIEHQESFGVGDVTDFTWRQGLDLYTCTECGRCSVNCPTTITGKTLNPKYLILDIRDHLYEREKDILRRERTSMWDEPYEGPSLVDAVKYNAIWDCTTCRACSEACPVMIEHVDKIVDMRRYLLLMESNFPKELGGTLKNLETKGNPWGLAMSDRAAWASEQEGLKVPTVEDNPDAEYIFWVGCAGAYDDQQKKVSRAVCELMDKAGISYAILGETETCTGDPARRAGNEYLFQVLAKQNIETLKAAGAEKKKLVTHCPHCFNTIKNEYPQFGGHFEIVHHSTLLDQLVASGKIKPKKTPEGSKTVTYHDSCYIGRYNDVYEEPRRAISAIPGLQLKEMARNRTTGMCCGAGGSRVWMEEHDGDRINHVRVDQALEVAPDTIAVACPFCNLMMVDGTKTKGIAEDVQTKDIAELMLESVS